MINFTVTNKYSDTKLLSTVQKLYPQLSYIDLQKLLRKKDIKVNGKRVSENIQIFASDKIDIYTNKILNDTLDIVYEDNNIIIINKPQEIEVLNSNSELSLLNLVKTYLDSDIVYPCHRLDRNTRGLVLFAKDEESLRILEEKIKDKEIKKFYICRVLGHMPKKSDTLVDFLFKDNKKSIVYISDTPKTGYSKIITKYTILSKDEDTSILEVELITGRTHQIRAHLSFIGHPIIGDGKYGNYEINKKYHKKYQELTAYKLIFDFTSDAGKLNYLAGKIIEKM